MSPEIAEAAVTKLFRRFSLIYGRLWLNRYDEIPMDEVRREWADGIRSFDTRHVGMALEQCRRNVALPPTLPEFLIMVRHFARTIPLDQVLKLVDNTREPMPLHIAEQLRAFQSRVNVTKGLK